MNRNYYRKNTSYHDRGDENFSHNNINFSAAFFFSPTFMFIGGAIILVVLAAMLFVTIVYWFVAQYIIVGLVTLGVLSLVFLIVNAIRANFASTQAKIDYHKAQDIRNNVIQSGDHTAIYDPLTRTYDVHTTRYIHVRQSAASGKPRTTYPTPAWGPMYGEEDDDEE